MPVLTPSVPDGLIDLMKSLAKRVLRDKPEDVHKFAAEYFDKLLVERDGAIDKKYETFTLCDEYFEGRAKYDITYSKKFVCKCNEKSLVQSNRSKKLPLQRQKTINNSEPLMSIQEEDQARMKVSFEDRQIEAVYVLQKYIRKYLARKRNQDKLHNVPNATTTAIQLTEEEAAIIIQRTIRKIFIQNLTVKSSSQIINTKMENSELDNLPNEPTEKEQDSVSETASYTSSSTIQLMPNTPEVVENPIDIEPNNSKPSESSFGSIKETSVEIEDPEQKSLTTHKESLDKTILIETPNEEATDNHEPNQSKEAAETEDAVDPDENKETKEIEGANETKEDEKVDESEENQGTENSKSKENEDEEENEDIVTATAIKIDEVEDLSIPKELYDEVGQDGITANFDMIPSIGNKTQNFNTTTEVAGGDILEATVVVHNNLNDIANKEIPNERSTPQLQVTNSRAKRNAVLRSHNVEKFQPKIKSDGETYEYFEIPADGMSLHIGESANSLTNVDESDKDDFDYSDSLNNSYVEKDSLECDIKDNNDVQDLDSIEEYSPDLHMAALNIQRNFRGYMVRKSLNNELLKKNLLQLNSDSLLTLNDSDTAENLPNTSEETKTIDEMLISTYVGDLNKVENNSIESSIELLSKNNLAKTDDEIKNDKSHETNNDEDEIKGSEEGEAQDLKNFIRAAIIIQKVYRMHVVRKSYASNKSSSNTLNLGLLEQSDSLKANLQTSEDHSINGINKNEVNLINKQEQNLCGEYGKITDVSKSIDSEEKLSEKMYGNIGEYSLKFSEEPIIVNLNDDTPLIQEIIVDSSNDGIECEVQSSDLDDNELKKAKWFVGEDLIIPTSISNEEADVSDSQESSLSRALRLTPNLSNLDGIESFQLEIKKDQNSYDINMDSPTHSDSLINIDENIKPSNEDDIANIEEDEQMTSIAEVIPNNSLFKKNEPSDGIQSQIETNHFLPEEFVGDIKINQETQIKEDIADKLLLVEKYPDKQTSIDPTKDSNLEISSDANKFLEVGSDTASQISLFDNNNDNDSKNLGKADDVNVSVINESEKLLHNIMGSTDIDVQENDRYLKAGSIKINKELKESSGLKDAEINSSDLPDEMNRSEELHSIIDNSNILLCKTIEPLVNQIGSLLTKSEPQIEDGKQLTIIEGPLIDEYKSISPLKDVKSNSTTEDDLVQKVEPVDGHNDRIDVNKTYTIFPKVKSLSLNKDKEVLENSIVDKALETSDCLVKAEVITVLNPETEINDRTYVIESTNSPFQLCTNPNDNSKINSDLPKVIGESTITTEKIIKLNANVDHNHNVTQNDADSLKVTIDEKRITENYIETPKTSDDNLVSGINIIQGATALKQISDSKDHHTNDDIDNKIMNILTKPIALVSSLFDGNIADLGIDGNRETRQPTQVNDNQSPVNDKHSPGDEKDIKTISSNNESTFDSKMEENSANDENKMEILLIENDQIQGDKIEENEKEDNKREIHKIEDIKIEVNKLAEENKNDVDQNIVVLENNDKSSMKNLESAIEMENNKDKSYLNDLTPNQIRSIENETTTKNGNDDSFQIVGIPGPEKELQPAFVMWEQVQNINSSTNGSLKSVSPISSVEASEDILKDPDICSNLENVINSTVVSSSSLVEVCSSNKRTVDYINENSETVSANGREIDNQEILDLSNETNQNNGIEAENKEIIEKCENNLNENLDTNQSVESNNTQEYEAPVENTITKDITKESSEINIKDQLSNQKSLQNDLVSLNMTEEVNNSQPKVLGKDNTAEEEPKLNDEEDDVFHELLNMKDEEEIIESLEPIINKESTNVLLNNGDPTEDHKENSEETTEEKNDITDTDNVGQEPELDLNLELKEPEEGSITIIDANDNVIDDVKAESKNDIDTNQKISESVNDEQDNVNVIEISNEINLVIEDAVVIAFKNDECDDVSQNQSETEGSTNSDQKKSLSSINGDGDYAAVNLEISKENKNENINTYKLSQEISENVGKKVSENESILCAPNDDTKIELEKQNTIDVEQNNIKIHNSNENNVVPGEDLKLTETSELGLLLKSEEDLLSPNLNSDSQNCFPLEKDISVDASCDLANKTLILLEEKLSADKENETTSIEELNEVQSRSKDQDVAPAEKDENENCIDSPEQETPESDSLKENPVSSDLPPNESGNYPKITEGSLSSEEKVVDPLDNIQSNESLTLDTNELNSNSNSPENTLNETENINEPQDINEEKSVNKVIDDITNQDTNQDTVNQQTKNSAVEDSKSSLYLKNSPSKDQEEPTIISKQTESPNLSEERPLSPEKDHIIKTIKDKDLNDINKDGVESFNQSEDVLINSEKEMESKDFVQLADSSMNSDLNDHIEEIIKCDKIEITEDPCIKKTVSLSQLPVSVDLISTGIYEDLTEIERIDITKYSADSLEGMYYSLRKNELMLDRMQRRSSEHKTPSKDNDLANAFGSNPCESIKSLNIESSTDTDDGILFKGNQRITLRENNTRSADDADQDGDENKLIQYTKNIFQKTHTIGGEGNFKIIDDSEDDAQDETYLDETTSLNIRQKMLAYSVSEEDSDGCEVPEHRSNGLHDDSNLNTALLEAVVSTDTDSTIISAATKIQAGARGFITRRRLRRASDGTKASLSELKSSFGNEAISESLENLVEEESARKIQNTFRQYRKRKDLHQQSLPDAKNNGSNNLDSIQDDCDKSSQSILKHTDDRFAKTFNEICRQSDDDAVEQTERIISKNSHSDNTSEHDNDKQLEPAINFDGTLAARRMTLHRGDAVQKDSIIRDEENSRSSSSDQRTDKILTTETTKARYSDAEKLKKLKTFKLLGIRQHSMPVQIESEVLRVIPKHMRKRIKSADGQKKNRNNLKK